MAYYVDSCIYINLWNAEETPTLKLDKIAERFFKHAEEDKVPMYYSGFVLKELRFILKASAFEKQCLLFKRFLFMRVVADDVDYASGRNLGRKSGFTISFYDCMHIVLAKKIDAILVTRDNALLRFAQPYVSALKPEQLEGVDLV